MVIEFLFLMGLSTAFEVLVDMVVPGLPVYERLSFKASLEINGESCCKSTGEEVPIKVLDLEEHSLKQTREQVASPLPRRLIFPQMVESVYLLQPSWVGEGHT